MLKTTTMRAMKSLRYMPVIIVLAALSACSDLTVPDFNNTSLDDLVTNPTPTKIAQASQGLLIGTRATMGAQAGYVSLLGIVGRESYNFDSADPRFITEMLIGPLDGGGFGGGLFVAPYRNIRNANILLDVLDQEIVGITDEQKEGVRGFAKTIQALDFLHVLNTRDDLGLPIDVGADPLAPPAPIVSKDAVFAHILQLLDEAKTHLEAAGDEFLLQVSPGLADFDTPESFLTLNRALKARVEVYMGNYDGALVTLGESFLDPNGSLDLGAYHTFSTGSGDTQNSLFDPTDRAILAHPSIVTDAQQKADGSGDDRVGRKVGPRPGGPRTVQGITTNLIFTLYDGNSAPIPIIRNEELILLRAEAKLFTNDLPGAVQDLDVVRTRSGGLAPYGGQVAAGPLLDELLYNRRYSLLFEGGHRWIDARRFDRLGELPLAVVTHTVPDRFPFPEDECLARGPAGCP